MQMRDISTHCVQMHVNLTTHAEMYRCINSILHSVLLCWTIRGRVCSRATCRRPSGSASRGWRWPGSWWRETSIKRDWWSCRRPSGGRRWYGQSLESHTCSNRHSSTEVCVLFNAERLERIRAWLRRKSPVSGSCKQTFFSFSSKFVRFGVQTLFSPSHFMSLFYLFFILGCR